MLKFACQNVGKKYRFLSLIQKSFLSKKIFSFVEAEKDQKTKNKTKQKNKTSKNQKTNNIDLI